MDPFDEEMLEQAAASSAVASTDTVTDTEVSGGALTEGAIDQGADISSGTVDVPDDLGGIVFGDDVFLPNPRKMAGLDDYYALKETLSWTNATNYWPDIGETDWVVLYDSAILTSTSPTVSIVKGETTNLTITGGKNLIFLDSSNLTINQTGGVSEIYYDPSAPAKIKLNITDGVSALSQVSLNTPDVVEGQNYDGSRTIQTGSVEIDYQTGDAGNIFLNDMISGQITKATPTFTLRDKPVITPNESEAPNSLPLPEVPEQVPDVPRVRPVRPIADKPDIAEVSEVGDDDPLSYFEDDVVIEMRETDVVADYFSLPQRESWQYAAETYRASDDLTINISINRQENIQKSEQVFESLQETNSDTIDQMLVMQQWDDLLSDDLMDLFYVD